MVNKIRKAQRFMARMIIAVLCGSFLNDNFEDILVYLTEFVVFLVVATGILLPFRSQVDVVVIVSQRPSNEYPRAE